jgi:putative ATPase
VQGFLFDPEEVAPSAKEQASSSEPLAARMRPRNIDEVVGQEHLLASGKVLRRLIEGDRIPSMIFWGPPGVGKTTLAEIIAHHTHARYVRLSAVSAGVADLRKVVEEARRSRQRTILFIDEIHRFNKAQQDAILPHVERGIVTLIGATTENPSFEVNSALLSRSRVFVLKSLSEEQVITIQQNALNDKERGLGQFSIAIDADALQQIAIFSNGDARTALNVLEMAMQSSRNTSSDGQIQITMATIEEVMQHRALLYDKGGDQHYDIISALHKSLRGSDPDAGLYWLARMLEAGEDPLYIIRRLIRFASEDVGMADSQALVVCMAAQQAIHFVGLPEANLALAQAVVYLATAPKSNALYEAYSRVQADVQQTRNDPVPLQIRNAPTRLMKNLDYGKDYKYTHDYYKEMSSEDPERPPATPLQDYLPSRIAGRRYYEPGLQGQEASINTWLTKRREAGKKTDTP